MQIQCVRSREAISLQLDDMLSGFEVALLDRHLRGCPPCRAFAASATEQTRLLRSAALERPLRSVVIPARPSYVRRGAAGAASAALVAAAAVLILTYSGAQRGGNREAARVAAGQAAPALVAYAGHPTPDPTIEVPRLRLEPASIADGPVHGNFSVPVVQF